MAQQIAFPHLRMIDLYRDGILYECAIVKEDKNNGDVFFIRIDHLDEIDRGRLRMILTKRNAATTALWDLMDQTALPNGMNALEFFHQFVKVRTQAGKIFNPQPGRQGAGRVQQRVNINEQQKRAGRPPKAAETKGAEDTSEA
jgi:hypothetical protein